MVGKQYTTPGMVSQVEETPNGKRMVLFFKFATRRVLLDKLSAELFRSWLEDLTEKENSLPKLGILFKLSRVNHDLEGPVIQIEFARHNLMTALTISAAKALAEAMAKLDEEMI